MIANCDMYSKRTLSVVVSLDLLRPCTANTVVILLVDLTYHLLYNTEQHKRLLSFHLNLHISAETYLSTMSSFNFIPPPSLFDQQHVLVEQVHHPGVALQNQQHVTIHQVHHPAVEIIHPAPFIHHTPPIPFLHNPMAPTVPFSIYPQPFAHPGAIAMQNFAPGALEQHLARQPRRLAHILTYSTARLAAVDATAHALYEQAVLATGLQPFIMFDVAHFPPPSPALAAQFTGISGPIQETVKGFDEGMRDL